MFTTLSNDHLKYTNACIHAKSSYNLADYPICYETAQLVFVWVHMAAHAQVCMLRPEVHLSVIVIH